MKAYVFVVNLIGGLWYKLKTAGFYLSFITTKWTEADKEKGKNVGEAKKNLATWIERKKAENLKINVHEKYIAWAMSKIKASKTLPKTGPNIFTKEVILGSRFSDTISKVDLRLEGEIEPENLIEQWITKLKDHCAKNNIPKNEMKTVKTHLEHWVNQNTSINFTQEFTTWQESNSGNRRKTMDDFLKEEIFGNANVSCHFNEEYSVDSLGKMSVDSVGENLKRMIELQNPANFDNENTYKYIIRNYDYRDLISGMTKLGVFMQSVFDEISKADNKESEMTEDVIKNISRYFKISLFAKEVSAIMDHLPDSHLLTILNTIYPNDRLNSETDSEKNDSEDQSDAMKLEAGQPNHLLDTETDSKKESVNNEQKIAQLRQFVRDCNRLSPKEFVRKYLIQRANSNRSDNCIAWFGTVFAEIKDCLCYYHRIDEQGGLDKASSPQLKRGRGHNIWDVDPYKSQIQDDSFMGRYLRMWNASAKFDAVSSLDEVHQIKSTHTIFALENVADNFIKPLRSYFSGNFFDEAARSIKSMQNLAPSEKTVFSLAKDLGERLVEAKPLTQEDILSPDTDHLNAVQKLRATFSRS